MLLRAKN